MIVCLGKGGRGGGGFKKIFFFFFFFQAGSGSMLHYHISCLSGSHGVGVINGSGNNFFIFMCIRLIDIILFPGFYVVTFSWILSDIEP